MNNFQKECLIIPDKEYLISLRKHIKPIFPNILFYFRDDWQVETSTHISDIAILDLSSFKELIKSFMSRWTKSNFIVIHRYEEAVLSKYKLPSLPKNNLKVTYLYTEESDLEDNVTQILQKLGYVNNSKAS